MTDPDPAADLSMQFAELRAQWARSQGEKVPDEVFERARKVLEAARAPDGAFAEFVARKVEARDLRARALQPRRRLRQSEGLPAKLISRNQENVHHLKVRGGKIRP